MAEQVDLEMMMSLEKFNTRDAPLTVCPSLKFVIGSN